MATAYIGLGGNVGDVMGNMAGALREFKQSGVAEIVAVANVYKTPPWGIEDQDWFHNSCAALDTRLAPVELLGQCLRIERLFKRERNLRWGPRTLDLDILLYDDLTVDEENLSIPHPRMHERSFVMTPLSDIAPDQEVSGRKIAEWLEELDQDDLELVTSDQEWWKQTRSS